MKPSADLFIRDAVKKVRDLFDQENLPRRERAIRNRIKSAGLWMR